jgi:hypothetical protein
MLSFGRGEQFFQLPKLFGVRAGVAAEEAGVGEGRK